MDFIALFLQILEQSDVRSARQCCFNSKIMTCFDVLFYLIHFGQWPVGQGSGTGSRLNPPEGFPEKGREWVSFSLRAKEAETKRKAILKHHTQMLVMGRFLLSFARANELFILEQAGQGLAKTMEKISCCGK